MIQQDRYVLTRPERDRKAKSWTRPLGWSGGHRVSLTISVTLGLSFPIWKARPGVRPPAEGTSQCGPRGSSQALSLPFPRRRLHSHPAPAAPAKRLPEGQGPFCSWRTGVPESSSARRLAACSAHTLA